MLLELILDNLPEAVWVQEILSGKVLMANQAVTKLYQLDSEVIKTDGDFWQNNILNSYGDFVRHKLSQLSQKSSCECVYPSLLPDGSTQWLWHQIQQIHYQGQTLRIHSAHKSLESEEALAQLQKFKEELLHRDDQLRDNAQLLQKHLKSLHQANKLLQQREAYLHSLIHSQSNSLIRINLEGNYTFANQHFYNHFGYHPEDLLKLSLSDMVVAEDALKCRQVIEVCLMNIGKVVRIILRQEHPITQELIQTEWEFVSICDETGSPVEIQGVGRDVTLRLKQEEEIQRLKQNLQALIDNTDDFIWAVDYQLCYTAFNKSYEDILMRLDNTVPVLGASALKVNNPSVEVDFWQARYQLALEGQSLTYINEIPMADGSSQHLEMRFYPIYNAQQQIIGVSCFGRDITPIKNLQLALEQKAQEVISIFESITDGFFAVDKQWKITYVNKNFELLLQRQRQNLIGKNLWDEFADAISLKFYSEYQRAMSEQVSVQFEEYYPTTNTWFGVSAYPSTEGLTVYFRDISASKAYQQALLEINERLREIAWIQAHEVRRPLASIIGLVRLLRQEPIESGFFRQLMDSLHQSAQALDEIIHQIVTKAEALEDWNQMGTSSHN
jgi:PAS domain S-box-containing protein